MQGVENIFFKIDGIMEEMPEESLTIVVPRNLFPVESVRSYLEEVRANGSFRIVDDGRGEDYHVDYVPFGGTPNA